MMNNSTILYSKQACIEYLQETLSCSFNSTIIASKPILCECSRLHSAFPIVLTTQETMKLNLLTTYFAGYDESLILPPKFNPTTSYVLLCIHNLSTNVLSIQGCIQYCQLVPVQESKMYQYKLYKGYQIHNSHIHSWHPVSKARARELLQGKVQQPQQRIQTVPFSFYNAPYRLSSSLLQSDLIYWIKMRLLLLQGYFFKLQDQEQCIQSHAWSLLQQLSIDHLLWKQLRSEDQTQLQQLLLLSNPFMYQIDEITFYALRILVKRMLPSRYFTWCHVESALFQWRSSTLECIQKDVQQLYTQTYPLIAATNTMSLLFQQKMNWLGSSSLVHRIPLSDWLLQGKRKKNVIVNHFIHRGECYTLPDTAMDIFHRRLMSKFFVLPYDVVNKPLWKYISSRLDFQYAFEKLCNQFIPIHIHTDLIQTCKDVKERIGGDKQTAIASYSDIPDFKNWSEWTGPEDPTLASRVSLKSKLWYQSAPPCLLITQHKCQTNTIHLKFSLTQLVGSTFVRLGYSFGQLEHDFLDSEEESTAASKKLKFQDSDSVQQQAVTVEQKNKCKSHWNPNKKPMQLRCGTIESNQDCVFGKDKSRIQVQQDLGILSNISHLSDIPDIEDSGDCIQKCRTYMKWRSKQLKNDNSNKNVNNVNLNNNSTTNIDNQHLIDRLTLLSIQELELEQDK